MMLSAGYFGNLFNVVRSVTGDACAILVLVVLPVLVPIIVIFEAQRSDLNASLWRALKVVGLFVVAAVLSCLLSFAKQAVLSSFLGGFGIGLIHLAIIGGALLLARSAGASHK
jgi:protein-S-isoprenylcysteine O-methyltransferase Ste14